MKPGRELDTLVAEKVMGMTRQGTNSLNGEAWFRIAGIEHTSRTAPSYSTDISAAWEVWEAPHCDAWRIGRSPSNGHYEITNPYEDNFLVASAPTAPHAICLAALKSVGAIE